MSELLIKRALPDAAALIEAVAAEDQAAVAEILTTLDTGSLHALAIVLAAQIAPATTDAEKMRRAVQLAAGTMATTTSDVLSISRRREALDARAIACYVGFLLHIPYARIGREIGRDHSTVMHACGRVGADARLRGIAQRLAEQLGWDREDGAA